MGAAKKQRVLDAQGHCSCKNCMRRLCAKIEYERRLYGRPGSLKPGGRGLDSLLAHQIPRKSGTK